MTPTEISKEYADLHDKWPDLRPDGIIFQQDRWVDLPSEVEGDGPQEHLAHSACLEACLKACAERGRYVHVTTTDHAHAYLSDVYLPMANPHTITEVMDRVMQLPKVKQ